MACSIFETRQSLLKFEGLDVVSLLQGVLSNDIRLLDTQKSLRAFHLTPKGKWVARLLLFKKEDKIFALTSPQEAEALKQSLKNILFLSDSTMQDVTTEYVVYLKVADRSSELDSEGIEDGEWASPAMWLLVKKNEQEAFLQKQNCPLLGTQAYEELQIQSKIPRFGFEVNEKTIPPQVGYGDDYFSYTKGCYMGQEIISRLKHYGRKT